MLPNRNAPARMGALEASEFSRALLGGGVLGHGAALGSRPVRQPEAAGAGWNIQDLGSSRRRAASVSWWETSATDTWNEHDTFTEYTLSEGGGDTSVSSTRASTTATATGSRQSRAWSVVVRGARVQSGPRVGYRGRSVTRRDRHDTGAALRHRHPTHTPSVRRRAVGVVASQTRHAPHPTLSAVPFLESHEIPLIGEERIESFRDEPLEEAD
mmetsp:Transcript_58083/g.138173  ORF Transcript_58083/g.138173 Transcript_58083/m.138173 type:complete len:213 (+) Transcript_58083:97-735(+)